MGWVAGPVAGCRYRETMNDTIIGRVPFTDGIERDVYLSGDGRQHVVDTAGMQVFGVWILESGDEDTSIDVVTSVDAAATRARA